MRMFVCGCVSGSQCQRRGRACAVITCFLLLNGFGYPHMHKKHIHSYISIAIHV